MPLSVRRRVNMKGTDGVYRTSISYCRALNVDRFLWLRHLGRLFRLTYAQETVGVSWHGITFT